MNGTTLDYIKIRERDNNKEPDDSLKKALERIVSAAVETVLDKDRLGDIVHTELGDINCYPGSEGAGCHEKALFISLTGKLGIGLEQIDMATVFVKIVEHMKICGKMTKHLIVLTDNWDPVQYEHHAKYLEDLRNSGVKIEIHLVLYPKQITQVEW